MTREEEIRQAALDCAEEYGAIDNAIIWGAFKKGAEWADQHPVSEEIFCKNDLNYIQGLEDGKKLSRWVSVEDRLPEKINRFYSEPVLCRYTRGGKVFYHVAQYDYDFDEWGIGNVTHWMPIPELKGGEK